MTIQNNLTHIRHQIDSFTQKYQRNSQDIQLLAVSKTVNATTLIDAIHQNQLAFGENYVQEAIQKQKDLQNLLEENLYNQLQWHFIGPIQRNKTKHIAENFDWVHSVDRLIIAERLSDQRPKSLQPLNICLQVNFDQEASKSGFKNLAELKSVVKFITKLKNIKLRGLMAIPKPQETFEEQCQSFQQIQSALNSLNHVFNLQLDTLSMGMTHDLESAIASGSTIVRVGTGIFGSRNAEL